MCDTMVALGNTTKDGNILFAKNSDRQPDEPAEILYIPRLTHDKGLEVQTTNITIPQVKETAEILLCKPIWIFGAEMGANEYGVTIGNEAIYTKEKYRKKGGLLGMDLLRLGLERGKTAKEALEVIIDLLELYGQGGNHGYRQKLFYHNSYIIADKTEAWVLETADKFWIAERVKDIRTISNTITIRGKGNIRHPELVENAIIKGWCKDPETFDFYEHYRDKRKLEQIFAMGMNRCNRSTKLLERKKGEIDESYMMTILRDHYPERKDWTPSKNTFFSSICAHAKNILNPAQTTISMVSELSEDIQRHWITGTSSPCTSIFKPFFMPGGVPIDITTKSSEYYEAKNLWWRHEKLHRMVIMDYIERLNAYKTERDTLEMKFLNEAKRFTKEKDVDKNSLIEFTLNKVAEAMKAEVEWIEKVSKMPLKKKPSRYYYRFWQTKNKRNKMPPMN